MNEKESSLQGPHDYEPMLGKQSGQDHEPEGIFFLTGLSEIMAVYPSLSY